MDITLKSTQKIVDLNGVPACVWVTHTTTGIPVHAMRIDDEIIE